MYFDLSSTIFFACVKPYVSEAPKPSRRRGCRHARVGRWCGVRGGAGRRGRCYGMYPIDPRLSRVAQRSVPRAFAGVMWGMRVGAATQKHRATLLRRAARARRAMGETSYPRGAGGARESVGSAEARVRPSPRPSSALAARARATGNIGFIVRKGRPGKKNARSKTKNLSRKGSIDWSWQKPQG